LYVPGQFQELLQELLAVEQPLLVTLLDLLESFSEGDKLWMRQIACSRL
jgi:hypothetical protein